MLLTNQLCTILCICSSVTQLATSSSVNALISAYCSSVILILPNDIPTSGPAACSNLYDLYPVLLWERLVEPSSSAKDLVATGSSMEPMPILLSSLQFKKSVAVNSNANNW